MQADPIALFIVLFLYTAVIWLIVYQVEVRLRPFARLKCKLGIHSRNHKIFGKNIKKYRCSFCKKPVDHLTVIQGGKKKIESNFKF